MKKNLKIGINLKNFQKIPEKEGGYPVENSW